MPPVKEIAGYIKSYYNQSDKRILATVTLFTALLIFFNYRFGLNHAIRKFSFPIKLLSWYGVFVVAFAVPYFLSGLFSGARYLRNKAFIIAMLGAPLLFSFKLTVELPVHFSNDANWNIYWEYILYWPFLGVLTTTVLYLAWRWMDRDQPFYGCTVKGWNWKPYAGMLLLMLPLIALASQQADFQASYPKLQLVTGLFPPGALSGWHRLLFELAYGTDFITIELFFRGFLILAFIKWVGKDAILPMACFYCSIHFGKPLGECISSYFGGLLLGIVVYHTRSIYGGLVVHLGIAWLMELAGLVSS